MTHHNEISMQSCLGLFIKLPSHIPWADRRGPPTVGRGLPSVGRSRTKCPDFHCTRVSVDSVNPT